MSHNNSANVPCWEFPHKIDASFFFLIGSIPPMNIEAVFCWVQFSHKIEAVFAAFEGVLWVRIMGS
jgi:hypothetical protein